MQITVDVVEVVRVILSISKLTKKGMQETSEHQGGSMRKFVRDGKSERLTVKWLGLMAVWGLYLLLLRGLGSQDRPPQRGDVPGRSE